MSDREFKKLGLEFSIQRPRTVDIEGLPATRDDEGRVIFPEVDADGDHVHFEMVPMGGDSLLWLTIRRGTAGELASSMLRKIADLVDREGEQLLSWVEGSQGSLNSGGEVVSGPLQLGYDEQGDLILPDGDA